MVRNVRVGVLVPSTNQVVEPDFARLMPQRDDFSYGASVERGGHTRKAAEMGRTC